MDNEITISEYNNLLEEEQYEAIWQHGFMVGKRIEGNYEIIQYRLFAFYVQLYYNITLNLFKRLKAFSKIESLALIKVPAFKPDLIKA